MDAVEVWKAISGWERYAVSSAGRVRNTRTGRILKTWPDKSGHLRVSLCVDYRQKTKLVHQLVLLAFRAPRPGGMVSRHLDGNPLNNTLENLAWGTQSQNVLDSVRHGTHYNYFRDVALSKGKS